MSFNFIFTDAGRSAFDCFEKNDCTVRAVALLFEVDYAVAHRALHKAGRRSRCRFSLSNKYKYIVINGKTLKMVKCLETSLSNWLSEDTAHYGENYILGIAGHCFCVKNGIVYDSESGAKAVRPRKIAKYFYALVNV